jgi:hypothetical protein
MNPTDTCELICWAAANEAKVIRGTIADLGSYDVHGRGGVRPVLPKAVGFDLVAGPGVDVVLHRVGDIPPSHWGKYSAVTSLSSFQFCPDFKAYRHEILVLLKPGGLLLLTMCCKACGDQHNNSPNEFNGRQELRWDLARLEAFFAEEMSVTRCEQQGGTYVLEACKP